MTKSARVLTFFPVRISQLAIVGAMATLLTLPAQAKDDPVFYQGPRLVVFDAPGATTKTSTLCAPECGTEGLAMNDSGTVVGFYTDDKVVFHGFIRYADGKYTSFEAPKAGTGPYLAQGTLAYTINSFGVIGGQYEDADNVYHGFIRYPDEHYEVVDVPEADYTANSGHGTLIYDNNDEGETAGVYLDAKGSEHAFYRSKDGLVTPIVPDKDAVAVTVCEETCLNGEGTAVGYYINSKNILIGFLRSRDGKITTFSAPNAGTSSAYVGTNAASISPEGDITGYTITDEGFAHGFVRYHDGTFSSFEIPESEHGVGTVPFCINAFGLTTGIYVDANSVFHGFERTPSDFVAVFDAPATAAGTAPGQGTRPSVNNIKGEVAGWTIDKTGLQHGFVWIP